MPMPCIWLRLVLTFWNKIIANEDWILYTIFRDNLTLALNFDNKDYWCSKIVSVLHHLEAVPGEGSFADFCNIPLDVDAIVDKLRTFIYRGWNDLGADPRSCPSVGAQICTYKNWFSCMSTPGSPPPHLSDISIPPGLHRRLMRFRLLCSDLVINVGRHTGTPRRRRYCRCCTLKKVEDELHFLFECPFYKSLRFTKYYRLFHSAAGQQCDMRAFMNSEGDQADIAWLLHDMFAERKLKLE